MDSTAIKFFVPRYVILVSGSARGNTDLTAFDRALLDAGIADLNLVKVTSIFPPYGKVLELKESFVRIPKGAIIPAVYTSRISADTQGTISSVIGVGVPRDSSSNGVIFEASIDGSKDWATKQVENMIVEAFRSRQIALKKIITIGAELVLAEGVGCTVAAALLL